MHRRRGAGNPEDVKPQKFDAAGRLAVTRPRALSVRRRSTDPNGSASTLRQVGKGCFDWLPRRRRRARSPSPSRKDTVDPGEIRRHRQCAKVTSSPTSSKMSPPASSRCTARLRRHSAPLTASRLLCPQPRWQALVLAERHLGSATGDSAISLFIPNIWLRTDLDGTTASPNAHHVYTGSGIPHARLSS